MSTTRPTAVVNVVGLSRGLIGAHTPNIAALAGAGHLRTLRPALPAVTCCVQSSMLTGLAPAEHGIVGNGWYNRELAEVQFWKQSNHLVAGEKVWEAARRRDPSVTCAVLFWWYNMYSSADFSVTPRPIYAADGRKIPDVYTHPASLRDQLQGELGRFPLFNFWGPGASIASSQWIGEACWHVHRHHRPTLTLVYLPHLDYALQKLGPGDPGIATALEEIDRVVGELCTKLDADGVQTILLSEYGIDPVHGHVDINRSLREAGWLQVREEQGGELLDAGASDAFAVADHQVAHVYLRDPEQLARCRETCQCIEGVESVLDRHQQRPYGIEHRRSGDLVLVAAEGYWFSYRYWMDDDRAPDFARTVDIHRKPGYDPLELFLDPAIHLPRTRIGAKLLAKRLGFRTLMNVIPLDPSLVKGSHGRVEQTEDQRPILITPRNGPWCEGADALPCTDVRDVILAHLFESRGG